MLSSYNITIRVSHGYFIFTRHLWSIHEFLFNAWHPVLNNYVIKLCPGLSAIVLKMQRVFVYGTLKKGQPNHHLISGGIESGDCRVEGVGVTEAKYPLIVTTRYNVPFLLDAPNARNAVVSGTLRRPNGKKW